MSEAEVRRIGCGIGYVIHGFVFEFDDGSRAGLFLEDNQEVMDIHDDKALQKRKLRWQEVEPGDFIVKVSGKHCRMGYLAGSVTFHTHAGHSIEFCGKRQNKFTKDYCFHATQGHFVCNVRFEDGRCIGIDEKPLPLKGIGIDEKPLRLKDGHCIDVEERPLHTSFRITMKEEGSSLGVTLIPSGQTWFVEECKEGGWGKQQGLQAADRLISINGQSPKDASTEEVHTLLRVRPLELQFERRGGIRKVAVSGKVPSAPPQLLPVCAATPIAVSADEPASVDAAESNEPSGYCSSKASSVAKVPVTDFLQATESQETRGNYRQALEALDSKSQWRAYMKPHADRLEKLFEEDYKLRKEWDFACSICQKFMGRGAGDHIPGDAHRKALLCHVQTSSVHVSAGDKVSCDLAASPLLQNFELLGQAITFNHLSGEMKSGNDGQTAVVPEKPLEVNPPQESEACTRSKQLGVEAAPDLAAAVAARTYLECIERRELWIEFVKPFAVQLRAVQKAICHKTGKLSGWKCAICSGADMSEADKHLLSKEHHDSMYWRCPQRAHFWEPSWDVGNLKGLTDARYVQLLATPDGTYLFNHVTGEQGYENEVNLDSASPVPPPLQFSFLQPGELVPCGYLADRGEALRSEHASQFRACLEFGRAPHRRWRNQVASSWHVKVPNGHYNVTLGLRGQDYAHPPGKFKKFQGYVNDVCKECKVQLGIQEVTFPSVHVWCNWITVGMSWPMHYLRIVTSDGAAECSDSAPRELTVPAFSEKACGTAKHWNAPDTADKNTELAALYWSQNGRNLPFQRTPFGTHADAGQLLSRFLETRPGPGGVSLLQRLGLPLRHEDGWFSFSWAEFDLDAKANLEKNGGKWKQAWHGFKIEALYSILYHKKLFASRDRELGERLFEGMPGVYVHKNRTSRKAENYMRFVPLCGDGIFWASKWEVLVDRKRGLDEHKSTDQWVQEEDSVQLVALWLCGRTSDEMRSGDQVSQRWFPEHEADPRKNLRQDCGSHSTAE